MTNRAFIIDNPTVTLGPDPLDTGGTEITVTCDLTRAEITNNVNMVDTGTLCGPAQQPGKIDYTIELDGYQSWEPSTDALGEALAHYLWTHARHQVPFKLLTKNAAVGVNNPIFKGILVCVPPEVGGTREEAAVFTAACPIVGTPTLDTVGPITTTAELEAQASASAPQSPSAPSGSSSGSTTAAA